MSSSSQDPIVGLVGKWRQLYPQVDDQVLFYTATGCVTDGFSLEDADLFLETAQAVYSGNEGQSAKKVPVQQTAGRASPQQPSAASPSPSTSRRSGPAATTDSSLGSGVGTGGEGEEVICYFTSITDSREVRDHCRQMELSLYLLKVTHHSMDVSDNPFMRRRLVEACGGRMLPLPLLFVGKTFVGDFRGIEEKVEKEELLEILQALGYLHKEDAFIGRDPSIHGIGDE